MPRKSPTKADPQVIWGQLLPLVSGGLSLPAALQQLPEPRPSLWWCKERIRDHPDLAAKYREAQEERADFLADQIVAVAEEPIPAGLSGPEASAWAQRQRLRVDAMKWTASKLRPRVWGDHIALGVAIDHQISITAALVAAEGRVAILAEEPPQVLELKEPARGRNG